MPNQRDRDHDRSYKPEVRVEILDPRQFGLPRGPQDDPAQVTDALVFARERCNVLAPEMQITALPMDHVINFMVVLLSPKDIRIWTTNEGEVRASSPSSNGIWYATDGGGVALHKAALNQLATAAEISWVPSDCGRTDDRKTSCRWAYRVTAERKSLTGRTLRYTDEFELDLRDGSPGADKAAGSSLDEAKRAKALRGARINGPQLCESKAKNRVMRNALGLKGAYSLQEADRPFVIPVLTWVPNIDDPVIRQMIAAKELGLTREMFQAQAEAAHVVLDPEKVADVAPERTAESRRGPPLRQLPDMGDVDELEGLGRERGRERQGVPRQRKERSGDGRNPRDPDDNDPTDPWDQRR